VEAGRFMGGRVLEARIRAIRRRAKANVDRRLDLLHPMRAVAFDNFVHRDDSV
jgi:hypothetical protein